MSITDLRVQFFQRLENEGNLSLLQQKEAEEPLDLNRPIGNLSEQQFLPGRRIRADTAL
jgi:hypothetical protein